MGSKTQKTKEGQGSGSGAKGAEALLTATAVPAIVEGIIGRTGAKGEVTQVKIPKTINFKSLKISMDQPECLTINYSDMTRPYLLHAIWRGQYDMEAHEDNVRTSNIDKYLEYVLN